MPFPNEHACRIREPGDFESDSFRRIDEESEGKTISLIIGRLKGEQETTLQSFRYLKDIWEPEEARQHCTEHDGLLFEPATEPDEEPEEPEDERAYSFQMEHRIYKFDKINVETRDDRHVIEGYGAVFHDGTEKTEYSLWDDVTEWIEKGAFDRVISEKQDVFGLFNHDPQNILGRTSSGTMKLSVDDIGIFYQIDVPDTSIGKDVLESIKRGDISGSSIGFYVKREEWETKEGKHSRRIFDIDMVDLGPVTWPAYSGTSAVSRNDVAKQSFDNWKEKQNSANEFYFRMNQLAERGIRLREC